MIDMRVFVVALLAALVLAASLVLRSCADGSDSLPGDSEAATSGTATLDNATQEPDRVAESASEAPPAASQEPLDPEEDRARRIESARLANAARLRARADAARDTLEAPVYFNFDGASIRADQQPLLRRKAAILLNSPGVTIRIEGHTDSFGPPGYNVWLGEIRAASVRNFLLDLGLTEDRIQTGSMGEDQLAEPGSDREVRARNRRAEFRVTEGLEAINPIS